jgi:hypothetical protein
MATSDAALRNLMSRQANALGIGAGGSASGAHQPPMVDNLINSIVEHGGAGTSLDTLDAALLEEFKQQVKLWCELDTAIKRLQNAIRERKKAQDVMKTKILDFMQRYRVEDLNTRDGVVRYKTAYVKAPLSQRNIRDKLTEYFTNDPAALTIIKKVFDDREQVEKVSLRRITNGGV